MLLTVVAMSLLAWLRSPWIVPDRLRMAVARLLAWETTSALAAAVAPADFRLVIEVSRLVSRLETSLLPPTVPSAAS